MGEMKPEAIIRRLNDAATQALTLCERLMQDSRTAADIKAAEAFLSRSSNEALVKALREAENGLGVALMWSDDDGTWVAHESVVRALAVVRAALHGAKER